MKMNDIKIGDFIINEKSRPFIIAEMSGNHNQSVDRALEIIDAAAECGADAVKLQTYTPDTMTIDHDKGLFYIDDPKSLWNGNTLYDLYKTAHTPWEWHKQIFDRAKEKGIMIFSTPFDASSVDFLETLDVPAYKIASFENKDWELLKKVAKTNKPVIMSTGASTISEISESVAVLKKNGCNDIILLKCTSTYPATPESTNLKTIPHMKDIFDCFTGLSDHTMGIGVPIASVALGAKVIEKHFTLDRSDGGVDSDFSIEPQELKSLVTECERAHQSLGKISYDILKDEESSLRFKRSIYVVKDIQKGEKFDKKNIRIIRPGDGMEPKYYQKIIGKESKNALKRGTPMSWELL
jgi:N-acetylneuraminate synthase